MKFYCMFGTLLFILTLSGCATGDKSHPDPAAVSARAIQAISAKDWPALAKLADPAHGVRFSPYAYVDTTNGVVLSAAEISSLDSDTQLRHWGAYDGTGEPIQLNIQSYFERFVCDRDFAGVKPGPPNTRIGIGNSLNNIEEIVSGREVVFFEYYLPGTKEYDEMDWRSLLLVFERTRDRWVLINIVHNEWTI